MTSLLGLAVFSGLSLNLLLQLALGTVAVIREDGNATETNCEIPLVQLGILFFSVIFLWVLFRLALPDFVRGFSEIFLYFPFSALVCAGFELLFDKLFPRFFPLSFPKFAGKKKVFSAVTAYEGLVPAALMITSIVAGSFIDSLTMALFFTLGNLMAMLIINEIRRRSTLEWIPKYLRGSPLILITMGLLSLVFAAAAGICFNILEALAR
jgi:electron transport complex protein RnfA